MYIELVFGDGLISELSGFWWGSSKKRDNYSYIFFIQSRRFGGLFLPSSGFWKVSEENLMWHSPLSVAVTILYSIPFSAEFSVKLSGFWWGSPKFKKEK